MIPRRFKIIPAYLSALGNARLSSRSATLPEIYRYLVQRSGTARGKRFVESEEEEDGFLKVRIAGLEHAVFYPAEFGRAEFYSTIDEGFDPRHWHQFVTPENPLVAGETVVDCGCADGVFAARAVEAGCEVVAFEPLPRFRQALSKTFEGSDGIEVLPYAVGHQVSSAAFSADETGSHLSAEGELQVEVTTLDESLLNREGAVSMIKADIEGFEYDMLLGAEELIRRDRPRLAITTYHQENNVYEMERFLSGIHGDYRFRRRGLSPNGNPILLYAY